MGTTPAPAGSEGGNAADRKRLGAFYTPPHTVEYMVGLLRGLSTTSRILEPSGGDGAFVVGLAEHTDIEPYQVHVWDIDEACRKVIEGLGAQFTHRDGLLGDAPPPTYTHVIGNPPYLNKQSAYIKENRARLQQIYREVGANDTYAMFTYRAVEALQEGGQLVFLISDTFLTLGIHKKLRAYLLANTTIDSITLLPKAVFADAAVKTAVLAVTKTTSESQRERHVVEFRDLSLAPVGEYGQNEAHPAAVYQVPQSEIAVQPNYVFTYRPHERKILTAVRTCPKLVTLLDGGLGMHTTNNQKYLGVVAYPGGALVNAGTLPEVLVADIDGNKWRYYHKRGGVKRWWGPAEHCVRWDEDSRNQYGIPATALAGEAPATTPPTTPPTPPSKGVRQGFVVSGVSARVSARLATPGAMWESNKAFVFFPKDPKKYPVEFFVAILNSKWYDQAAKALNHTVSLQVRDLQALPLLDFTDDDVTQLARLGAGAIAATKAGRGTETQEAEIEKIVRAAAKRSS